MKIYLTTSFRNKEQVQQTIRKITAYSRESGHSINDIVQLFEADQSTIAANQNKVVKLIKGADVVIAELSNPSSGVGFEIALAIIEKKPTLVLVNHDNKSNLSSLIKDNKSKLLSVKTYKNETDLETCLKYFFRDAKDKIDTKFILIIPPSIDRYLEWNARERGVPKAEVTRDAIEEIMKHDKKYLEYLAQNEIE